MERVHILALSDFFGCDPKIHNTVPKKNKFIFSTAKDSLGNVVTLTLSPKESKIEVMVEGERGVSFRSSLEKVFKLYVLTHKVDVPNETKIDDVGRQRVPGDITLLAGTDYSDKLTQIKISCYQKEQVVSVGIRVSGTPDAAATAEALSKIKVGNF